jgi:hypothetical protein
MVASEAGTETVWQVAMEQSKHWKSVNPKACEPREGLPPNIQGETVDSHKLTYRGR